MMLVADDDPVALDLLAEVLRAEGYAVLAAGDGAGALRLCETHPVDLAIVDLQMPDLNGLEVVKRLRAIRPETPIVIITAFASVDTAVEAIHAGAYDYLSKPFRMEQVRLLVGRALEARRLARENVRYRQELVGRFGASPFVGRSPQMVEVFKVIARVAKLDTTVLIQGETGSGKELVARAIHFASDRGSRPFVVVDCTALPETLFESEVFGHERGAFTGAVAARRGLLETAAGGTCFLDEVGELSHALQGKLLRALQERTIRRLGGNDQVAVNARIIAATNRNLAKRVEEGAFREDLYYRLHVVTLAVPPLRERPEDIPLLVRHFLDHYAASIRKPVQAVAPEAMALLCAYHWPGNVRELEHTVERAVALCSTPVVMAEDLAPHVRQQPAPDLRLPVGRMTLEEVKQWYVARVLEEAGGNKAHAAEILGIDRTTLYRVLRRQGDREEGDA
jgi:DNA-binding NtrC family response regulator